MPVELPLDRVGQFQAPGSPQRPPQHPPRRQTSQANGRALEILGHAIEYLADEYAVSIYQLQTLDAEDPHIEAIQILMALNREVYYSCPKAEPVWQRMVRWVSGSQPSRPQISRS